jgi:hypothetical protein
VFFRSRCVPPRLRPAGSPSPFGCVLAVAGDAGLPPPACAEDVEGHDAAEIDVETAEDDGGDRCALAPLMLFASLLNAERLDYMSLSKRRNVSRQKPDPTRNATRLHDTVEIVGDGVVVVAKASLLQCVLVIGVLRKDIGALRNELLDDIQIWCAPSKRHSNTAHNDCDTPTRRCIHQRCVTLFIAAEIRTHRGRQARPSSATQQLWRR